MFAVGPRPPTAQSNGDGDLYKLWALLYLISLAWLTPGVEPRWRSAHTRSFEQPWFGIFPSVQGECSCCLVIKTTWMIPYRTLQSSQWRGAVRVEEVGHKNKPNKKKKKRLHKKFPPLGLSLGVINVRTQCVQGWRNKLSLAKWSLYNYKTCPEGTSLFLRWLGDN